MRVIDAVKETIAIQHSVDTPVCLILCVCPLIDHGNWPSGRDKLISYCDVFLVLTANLAGLPAVSLHELAERQTVALSGPVLALCGELVSAVIHGDWRESERQEIIIVVRSPITPD